MLRVLLGLAARVPGLNHRVVNRGTGGTDRASYCYGVWLKHLALLGERGVGTVPRTVGELGPGDSVGVGLAALLSGADTYLALDVKAYASEARNLEVFDELVELFARRAPRPTRGWPDFDHLLDERLFAGGMLSEERLSRSLAAPRLSAIREALADGRSRDGSITLGYRAPWDRIDDVAKGSVELILSHSVMEHVADLDECYGACAAWLSPGGWMSHQIDFQSHGLASKWNGCWAYASDAYWELIAGRRDCKINRAPFSAHVGAMRAHGFEIECALQRHRSDGIARAELAPRWRELSDDDLACAGAFVQARKPA